jgi:hypothetical protein
MANSLSNIQQTSFETYHQVLGGQPKNYEKLGRVIETDQASLQKSLIQGGSYFAEYTAAGQDITTDVLSGKVVFASKAYAQGHTVSFKEIADNPSLLTEIPTMLANNAAKSLNKLMFDGLEAMGAVNHPLSGSAVNQVGTKKCFDTGLAYLQGASGAGTQSNLFLNGLSRASIDGDLQTLFNWKSTATGMVLELQPETADLVLVATDSNRELAMQIKGSAVSGADLQSNTMAGLYDLCLAGLARAEDYYLISRKADVINPWIRQYPQLLVRPSANGMDVIFTANFIAAFAFSAEVAGAIFHKVG